ncbi:hypothetical protein C8J57DRAFT_1348582 [Mycena rebaudengoi]|nr:hypothetical protein C8J57DRAFT_1348582 [Mycena rebaudengoi]
MNHATMNPDYLGAPVAPFHGEGISRPSSPAGSTHSLTVNYLPSKFSTALVSRRRKGAPVDGLAGMMPRGGGVEAFRSGAARMPSSHDTDYDGVEPRKGVGMFGGGRWTRFKVILFISNIVLAGYSLVALVFTLLTWFRTFRDAPILLVANRTELVLSTLAASFAFFVSLIGLPGVLLNNRPFLAVYTFLLWIAFGLLVIPGYLTYKHSAFNLEGKVNQQWSQLLSSADRLVVQDLLGCCGYFSPFVEATVSSTCYARSNLPGCKKPFIEFQEKILIRWYTIVFGIVPAHVAIMIAALLCSNHVTYRFGKGMMPKAYRLSKESMAVIMEKYASQLAEQYGPDAAAHILAASSGSTPGSGYLSPRTPGQYASNLSSANNSDIHLTSMPYASGGGHAYGESAGSGASHAKYDSLGGRGDPDL